VSRILVRIISREIFDTLMTQFKCRVGEPRSIDTGPVSARLGKLGRPPELSSYLWSGKSAIL